MALKKSSVSVDDIEDVVVKKKPTKVAEAAPVAKKVFPGRKKPPIKKPGTGIARPAPLRFAAPSDFKPFFAKIDFRTGTDGLISPEGFEMIRYRGRWDNENAKTFDMSIYDPQTVLAVATRLSAVTYAPNVLKRLPADTAWSLIIRVGKRAVDDSLMTVIKQGSVTKDGDADGRKRWYKDIKNLVYRRLRRFNRVGPSAFINVQLTPALRKKSDKSDDE